MDITVSARAQCLDGLAGQVTHLIVDRAAMRVTYVVVKEARCPHSERLVPFAYVGHPVGHELRFRCALQELCTMQPGNWTEMVSAEVPVPGGSPNPGSSIKGLAWSEELRHPNLAKTSCALGASTRVRATDGNAGRLAGLTVEPSNGDITHLLLWKGHTRDMSALALPVAAVAEVGAAAVYVRSTRARIAAMAPQPGWSIRSMPLH
jgi:hypothetical protein